MKTITPIHQVSPFPLEVKIKYKGVKMMVARRAIAVVMLGVMVLANPESVIGFHLRSNPFCHSTKTTTTSTTTTTTLFMAKLRNRQAELQKKFALAKKQNANKQHQQQTESEEAAALSNEEIKELNDRKRFEELLKGSKAFLGTGSDDDYLSIEQEEESIDAYRT
jgi:mannitol-specific phosphotransferase system IIBC component